VEEIRSVRLQIAAQAAPLAWFLKKLELWQHPLQWFSYSRFGPDCKRILPFGSAKPVRIGMATAFRKAEALPIKMMWRLKLELTISPRLP